MDRSVIKLFDEYEKAFSSLNVEGQVATLARHFISAGPKGGISQSREEFAQLASKATEFYKQVGQKRAKMLSLKEMPISPEYIMIVVHWGVTFENKKVGQKVVEFDVTYIVQKLDDAPKILMFITHTDEGEAMKELV